LKIDVKVIGHQRCGNNYLANLIKLNFGDDVEVQSDLHGILSRDKVQYCVYYVYIVRRIGPVMKSMYKLRNRFGLNVSSYNEFKKTRYRDMWSENIKSKNVIIDGNNKSDYVSDRFKKNKHTPIQWYNKHVSDWVDLKSEFKNICIIHYEDLIINFNGTMNRISDFFGLGKRKSFKNIDKKVGPRIIDDEVINKKYIDKMR